MIPAASKFIGSASSKFARSGPISGKWASSIPTRAFPSAYHTAHGGSYWQSYSDIQQQPYALHGSGPPIMYGTTILCVRKNGKVVMIGDGQVSLGSTVVKPNAKKVRRLGKGILAGFAGSTADAYTLMERLERKLEEHPGQLMRACVELAKNWRTDKYLRRLEAMLVVADINQSFTLSGLGDVLEPHDGVVGIGSGGVYAISAARALIDVPDIDALQVAQKSMTIASDICVYTNSNYVIETLDGTEDVPAADTLV